MVGQKFDETCYTVFGCDTTGGTSPPVSSGQALMPSRPQRQHRRRRRSARRGRRPARIRQRSCAMGLPRLPLTFTSSVVWTTASPRTPSIATTSPQEPGHRTHRCHLAMKRLPARSMKVEASSIARTVRHQQFAAYNIATDSWTPLAPDPFAPDHYGSASGFFNGKVFVAGGTGDFSNQVDVYDVGTNTWSPGTPAPVGPFLLAGYHQIGQFLYVVGGFDPSALTMQPPCVWT